jgi:hypothetical protein
MPLAPARQRAAALRWCVFSLAIIANVAAIILLFNPILTIADQLGGGVVGTPFGPIKAGLSDDQSQSRYWGQALFFLGIYLFTQWLFLKPRGSWRIRLATGSEPLPRRAALAAGFIGMLLSIGFLATLLEIPNWWLKLTAKGDTGTTQHFRGIWLIMIAVWIFWTIVFHSYCKSLDRYTALRRIFRWLIAGTILELMITAPAHAWVLHSRDSACYCERGTWTGVAFGATAVFWLFGPGAGLLFLREARRRERLM